MAYNNEKLTKLSALEALAQRVKTDCATKGSVTALEGRVNQLAVAGRPVFEKVDAIPTVEEAQTNILYLVMNPKTNHYDIYALVGGSVELLDDTTVDLSGYSTTEAVQTMLESKVDKVSGKGLSANDYTDADKAKLGGLEIASDAEVQEMLNSVFGA